MVVWVGREALHIHCVLAFAGLGKGLGRLVLLVLVCGYDGGDAVRCGEDRGMRKVEAEDCYFAVGRMHVWEVH
jgi:hypothetical protein